MALDSSALEGHLEELSNDYYGAFIDNCSCSSLRGRLIKLASWLC